jgi:fructokinase
MVRDPLYGGVEAGGTKFICTVGRGPAESMADATFATTTPAATLGQVAAFLEPFCREGQIRVVGVGCFGPCDLRQTSSKYGYITSTPKPGWQNTDVVGTLATALSVEIAFDTDVNAAALGEYTWGAARGTDTSLYLTIGTGIGGGYIVDGQPLHGLQHPEMGHIAVPHDRGRDPFPGSCPYHGDCLEGLASGPAIQRRFGRRGEELSDADPFWDLEAGYIAAALSTYILVNSPQRIVLGGGIMQRDFLLARIRQHAVRLLAGYIRHPALGANIDEYIVAPALGSRSGVLGAIALAAAHANRRN